MKIWRFHEELRSKTLKVPSGSGSVRCQPDDRCPSQGRPFCSTIDTDLFWQIPAALGIDFVLHGIHLLPHGEEIPYEGAPTPRTRPFDKPEPPNTLEGCNG